MKSRSHDGEMDHKEDEDVWVLNSLQISVTQTRDVPLMKERERDILSKQKQLEFVLELSLKARVLKEVHLQDSGEEEHQVDCEGRGENIWLGRNQTHQERGEWKEWNGKGHDLLPGEKLTIFGERVARVNLEEKENEFKRTFTHKEEEKKKKKIVYQEEEMS